MRGFALEDVDESLGEFDTLVMFGNNFGLFGSRAKRVACFGSYPFVRRIVATSNDPFGTDDPVHLGYHERNRNRGRMPGQLRLRVRYRDLIGPWFEYPIVSPEEMAEIVEGTGWEIRHLIQDEGTPYVAVLERRERAHRGARASWPWREKKSDCGRGLAGVFEQRAGHGEDDAGDAVSTPFRNGIFPTWSSQNAEESSVVTPVESQHTQHTPPRHSATSTAGTTA